MGIDLYAKKGKIELCFGRAYHYKENSSQQINDLDITEEIEKINEGQERASADLKGYVKCSPKNIKDTNETTKEFGWILEDLLEHTQRLGSLLILEELEANGFTFEEV